MRRLQLLLLLIIQLAWAPANADLIIWANNGEDKVTKDDLRANEKDRIDFIKKNGG